MRAASWPTSGSASISRSRWRATTRRTTPGCRIRSRPSRSGRCGGPSAPRRGGSASSPSATSTSLGQGSGVVEVELILATCEALTRLGLTDLTVRINDRRLLGLIARHCGFEESAQAGFFITFDKLDKLGPEGVLAELRRADLEGPAVDRFARPAADPAEGRALAGGAARPAGGRRGRGGVRVARVDRRRRRRVRCRAAAGCSSIPRSCAAWATTPGRSSRSARRPFPRRSRAGDATTGWSASCWGGTSPPAASPSASSGSSRSWSSAARLAGVAPPAQARRIALLVDQDGDLGRGPGHGPDAPGRRAISCRWSSSARTWASSSAISRRTGSGATRSRRRAGTVAVKPLTASRERG